MTNVPQLAKIIQEQDIPDLAALCWELQQRSQKLNQILLGTGIRYDGTTNGVEADPVAANLIVTLAKLQDPLDNNISSILMAANIGAHAARVATNNSIDGQTAQQQ